MTTTTPAAPRALDGIRLGFSGLVRSEWIKLRSVRSTMWCYGLIILLTIGFGLLYSATVSESSDISVETQNSLAVQGMTLSVNFTQLIAAVLGVLVISGEYGTGMIRSTFTAAPGRLSAYFAKALVLAVTTFVVSVVSIAVTALVTAPILSGKGIDAQLGESSVLLPLLGGAVYLTLIAVLAFTFGAIVRNSAGGIASVLGLVLVVPVVLQIFGALTRADWITNLAAFTPSNAGGKIFAYVPDAAQQAQPPAGIVSLNATEGLLVLIAWVVVFGIVGALLTKRRDV
ncbi:ABC transporter permease [Microbacterium sp. STN6]|uniref:ABC transporter permease n=1 Tax=Microbacterium sp. STN6 TaxID=2995588 RepID=UPI002260F7B7|nr:ABC transporter permease [Microbacterium sp. STN6]MCX7522200.1 ABC transporter permease [Microbacterium sp. STN6]